MSGKSNGDARSIGMVVVILSIIGSLQAINTQNLNSLDQRISVAIVGVRERVDLFSEHDQAELRRLEDRLQVWATRIRDDVNRNREQGLMSMGVLQVLESRIEALEIEVQELKERINKARR